MDTYYIMLTCYLATGLFHYIRFPEEVRRETNYADFVIFLILSPIVMLWSIIEILLQPDK